MKHIRYLAIAAWALVTLTGCDETKTTPADTSVTDIDLDVPPGGYTRVIPNTAFEGVSWLVVGLQPNDASVDLTGATVRVDTHSEHVTITEQACNAVRCAVVLSIEEFLDPIGQPIPRPIDAQNVMLRIDPPGGTWSVGTLSVFPLDFTNHITASSPIRLRGTFLMSSFTMGEGTQLIPNTSDPTLAGRLFVTGPVTIAGTFGLAGGTASGAEAGSASLASGAGGAAGAAGVGPGAGLPGTGGGAGGGGSHAGTGTQGADGTGSGGAAGVSYGDMTLASLVDDEAGCGGSGGGGSGDAGGGAGGGALLITSLHSITFGDATIDVSGGDGATGTAGGGGGSGGALLLAAPFITGSATLVAAGGQGGAGSGATDGGNGGTGRIRIDADTTGAALSIEPSFHATGPVIDRFGLELIDDDGQITVSGWATPDSAVRVTVIPETAYGSGTPANFTTTATAEGTFSVTIDVLPGMSHVTLAQTASGITTVGMVGNTFEVAGSIVQGTVLYIASVPPAE